MKVRERRFRIKAMCQLIWCLTSSRPTFLGWEFILDVLRREQWQMSLRNTNRHEANALHANVRFVCQPRLFMMRGVIGQDDRDTPAVFH